MEAFTTIKNMLANNKITVPTYQRAYSWETPKTGKTSITQTDVFLSDLEEYRKSESEPPYYFGHFLFEEKNNNDFCVIDGQQRITTVIIFLSALFTQLKDLRKLNEKESFDYQDIIKRESKIWFSTVNYDNQLFTDYVINQEKTDKIGIETISGNRIIETFDYFKDYLSDKSAEYLTEMLSIILNATCTTHPVKNETEAIQMFIFQNNRGKAPTNLEIIKAQFLYNINLNGGEETNSLIEETKNRFEVIYKSISKIENNINEDDVLTYTLRVYFNSLDESNAINKINKRLNEPDSIPFIRDFTESLSSNFNYLTIFFGKDERENIEIHSLITLGSFAIAIPFILKAYSFGLETNSICQVCNSLESILLRNTLIGTRAKLSSRINETFKNFTKETKDIKPIIDKIELIKNITNDSRWLSYWNNEKLKEALQGGLNHSTAKFLLWKYENYLESQLDKNGYSLTRFEKIKSPSLEHIAPTTPTNGEPIAAGYCEYDEEFKNQYLNCLGNYLLISKSHNSSIGNIPFNEKHKSYKRLEQQREIRELVSKDGVWSKELILKRKEKIVDFIMSNF